jgi:hypothetical protein
MDDSVTEFGDIAQWLIREQVPIIALHIDTPGADVTALRALVSPSVRTELLTGYVYPMTGEREGRELLVGTEDGGYARVDYNPKCMNVVYLLARREG